MPPTRSLGSTTWNWSRCWTPSGASRLLHEPPDAEPHVRWCGRTARVTSPPTRSPGHSNSAQFVILSEAKDPCIWLMRCADFPRRSTSGSDEVYVFGLPAAVHCSAVAVRAGPCGLLGFFAYKNMYSVGLSREYHLGSQAKRESSTLNVPFGTISRVRCRSQSNGTIIRRRNKIDLRPIERDNGI